MPINKQCLLQDRIRGASVRHQLMKFAGNFKTE